MARFIATVLVDNSSTLLDEHTVSIDVLILRKCKIPMNQPVFLQCGSLKSEVRIVPSAKRGSLHLPESIAERCGLHAGTRLCVHYKPLSYTLQVGPIIGVMVSRIYTRNHEKPFGAMSSFCKELTDACKEYGAFVYFCTPDELSANTPTVAGMCYSNGWRKKRFPIPDVIYNRLTSRKLENRANVQQFLKNAKTSYGTVVFNEKYLNKTEVFQALKKDATVHDYLPESHLFKNFQMLKTMLASHPILFLKPTTGSLGIGIIRISKISNTLYQSSCNTLNGVRKQTFNSLQLLFSSISSKLKHQRYQLQQGLRLIEIHNRPVDFRVLVQRDRLGEWSVTSIVARIAGNNNFASNLARGGTLSPVGEAIAKSALSSQNKLNVISNLRRAALLIAKGIEKQIPSHFAELGVDLALDNNGKIWLIEVNSKPSKDENSPLNDESKIRPSVYKVIQYSQFLSKF